MDCTYSHHCLVETCEGKLHVISIYWYLLISIASILWGILKDISTSYFYRFDVDSPVFFLRNLAPGVHHFFMIYTHIEYLLIWRFPFRHRVTPSHHPLRTMGFSLTETIQRAGGSPMTMETSIWLNMIKSNLAISVVISMIWGEKLHEILNVAKSSRKGGISQYFTLRSHQEFRWLKNAI